MFKHYKNSILTAAMLTGVFVWISFAAIDVRAQSDEKAEQAVALFNQGQDAHEKGDLKAAIELYEKALGLLPEFPEAELQRGSALVTLKKFDDAERAFRRAIELREGWTLAMANLGSLLVERGKFPEAEKLLVAALEADETSALALTALAELRLRTNAGEKELRNVLVKLNDLAGKVRPPAQLMAVKAAIELKLGDRAAAKASAVKALEIDAKLTSPNIVLADLALKENDLDQAERHVGKLELLSPKTEDTITLRARILFARGKKTEGLTLLESIQNPSISTREMIAEIRSGDSVDLPVLEERIKQSPTDANVLAKLCQGFRLSDPVKALEYCKRASTAEPNEISHAVGYGAALVQAKQYDAAVGLFRKLLTIAPEHATIRANLATALFQLKRFPEAKTEFRWLTEKNPGSPAAFYFLGITHDQLGEYLDAMANYQQFLRLANAESNKLEIEKVNLRLPAVQKQIKNGKGKKSG